MGDEFLEGWPSNLTSGRDQSSHLERLNWWDTWDNLQSGAGGSHGQGDWQEAAAGGIGDIGGAGVIPTTANISVILQPEWESKSTDQSEHSPCRGSWNSCALQ